MSGKLTPSKGSNMPKEHAFRWETDNVFLLGFFLAFAPQYKAQNFRPCQGRDLPQS